MASPGANGSATAPTLILLHGLTATHRMWDPQREAWAGRFSLLTPDLPGYGTAPGPFTLDRAVSEVAALTADHSEVHICGLSLGAIVALRVTAQHPDRVRSLILSGVQLRVPPVAYAVQRFIMKLVPAAKFSAEDPGVTKEAVLTVLRAMAREDMHGDLRQVAARTLVLCGARDRLNLTAARAAATGIADAELRVIPAAGHLWNLEQPQLFNHTVSTWIASTVPG